MAFRGNRWGDGKRPGVVGGCYKDSRTHSHPRCNFRIADIHVSHLSSGGTGVPGTLGRACKSSLPGCSTRNVCLSASVPALGRTRHPFAVSGLEGPSQKIEFVFSASPETIRREPREIDLLCSVGNRQDLPVSAFVLPGQLLL